MTSAIEEAKEEIIRWVSDQHFTRAGVEHRIEIMPEYRKRLFSKALKDIDIESILLKFSGDDSEGEKVSFNPTEADKILSDEVQKICYEEWLNGSFMYDEDGKNPKGKTDTEQKIAENEALVNMYKSLCLNSKNEKWKTIKFKFRDKHYSFLSNFENVAVEYNGRRYRNAEAAYQSMKTLDIKKRWDFVSLLGVDAIKLAKTFKTRPDWDEVKYDILVEICYAKFSSSYDMTTRLLSTGKSYLYNDTTGWHDNELGNCECPRCAHKIGKNLLGQALMQVREMMASPGSL